LNSKPLKSRSYIALLAVAGLSATSSQAAASIAAGAKRSQIAGIDVIADRTAVKDVVVIFGSLPAGNIFNPAGKPATALLVGQMLDKGTTRQDKFALARRLDEVGASVHFGTDNFMTTFSVTCLKENLPLVLALLAEELRMPAFAAEEFDKLKTRLSGALQKGLEDPGARASESFDQAVYPQGHPNKTATVQETIEGIKNATLMDLKSFHAAHYGPAHMTMVIAGDFDLNRVRAALQKSFSGWKGGTALPPALPSAAGFVTASKEQTLFVPGKTSVVMLLGQATGLKYRDPDALALRVGTTVLGSGFTGRLMNDVRDQEGLTYSIGANLSNDTFADGEWKISATFAPALLDKGIASTRRQLTEWYQDGITAAELEQRKTQLTGSYYVSLATPGGLAQALLVAVQRGYNLTWLDEYPKAIQALTVAQVNGAIKKHLEPGKMLLIKAGTVGEDKS
jgi:zinc protease